MSTIKDQQTITPELVAQVQQEAEAGKSAQSAQSAPPVPEAAAEEATKTPAVKTFDDDFKQMKTPQGKYATGTAGTAVAPQVPPTIKISPTAPLNAEVMSENMTLALKSLLTGGAKVEHLLAEGAKDGSRDPFKNASVDALMKLFMMLQILDPNNSNEVKNQLSEIKSQSRQSMIDANRAAIKNSVEKLKEMEKEAAFWNTLMDIVKITPMGLAMQQFEKTGLMDNEVVGIIVTILCPMYVGIQMVSQKKAKKVEDKKADIQAHQKRADRQEKLVAELMKDDRKKAQRNEHEQYIEMKKETASAGEDGVPKKGLAQKLKPKLDDMMAALAEIGTDQGIQPMLDAAPQMLRDLLVPAFEAEGFEDAAELAEGLINVCLTQLTQEKTGFRMSQAIGPATTMLGHTLDPEVKGELPKTPEGMFAASQADALDAIAQWAAEAQATRRARDTGRLSNMVR